MHENPQVGLLIETARGYGRAISLGIARFARLHGPWTFHLTPGDFDQTMPEQKYWHGDGIFARVGNKKFAEQLLESKLPTIALDLNEEQLQPGNPLSQFTDLRVDSEKAAQLVASHLIDRRYSAFAFVGKQEEVWSDRRKTAFCAAITAAGHETSVFEPIASASNQGLNWEEDQQDLVEWLKSLPKPVGIMACNDAQGLRVLDACREASLSVPKDVAVVGVDNDELLCELANPTLSSVSLNAIEGGFRAAAKLDKMMRTGENMPGTIIVDALRVITRQSSNSIALDDRSVADAIDFIKRSQGRDISAEMVAKQADVSRRELDSRFREFVGHSMVAEIQRVRLSHAKRLLEETDYPIPDVAKAAGYSSPSYMIQVFRRELNTTPAKYRAGVRMLSVGGQSDLQD